MAEINFNNLYNQLSPMDRRYYDQQFQKSYNPNQENIMLSSQPAYEQMKTVYDAQQQVPETGIFDSIFGSASAAEKPQVPNLTYRNIDLPFDLGTGVTNTTQAAPFLKSMADIDPKSGGSGVINSDLVNQLIMKNQMKASQFDPRNFRSIFPTNVQTGIRQQVPLQNLGIDTSYGVANEEDVEQEFLPGQERSGIAKLFEFLGNIPTPFNLVRRGLESLRGLNQKIRSTDFAQSKTLADYFDARRYGGRDARDAAAARNMAQARGITKSLASRPSSTSGGYQQGPGGSGAQSTGASRSRSQAGPGFSGSGSAAEMGSF
jgi:hypothetical protein